MSLIVLSGMDLKYSILRHKLLDQKDQADTLMTRLLQAYLIYISLYIHHIA